VVIESPDKHLLPARITIVDGCFDPLHRGHLEYFRRAAGLGLPVLCNLASDDYIRVCKKREPLLEEQERAAIIDALRYIDFVYICRWSTARSLDYYRPVYYVKGIDWKGRLPTEEIAICAERNITVVYVDCAWNSSTRILERYKGRSHVCEAV
jgi:D-beta-D-heptose 7-phosphate kinase/D-beta-D-heptose 1-phosphate adenosyltransferase